MISILVFILGGVLYQITLFKSFRNKLFPDYVAIFLSIVNYDIKYGYYFWRIEIKGYKWQGPASRVRF